MTDIAPLLTPEIAHHEGFHEFVESLADHLLDIERDIAALRRSPRDRLVIARLFRALHSVKGDAAVCEVGIGVRICQPLETLLARCREGEVLFSDLLAELMLLSFDRLELLIEAMESDRNVGHLRLQEMIDGLDALAVAPPQEIGARSAKVIEQVTGFRPQHLRAEIPTDTTLETTQEAQAADLWFFSTLALQLESRSPLFAGRTGRVLKLAEDTNSAAGSPVDPIQLAAAVYLHDIGMMFVPESTWLKPEGLTGSDRELLRNHPLHAAGLLQRMAGWEVAAEVVRQHHETPTGSGYPEGLGGADICAGAKILAIVDAFEAVTLKHRHRGETRSLVRAIAEINACDDQFAAEWIEPFNRVIRKMVEN